MDRGLETGAESKPVSQRFTDSRLQKAETVTVSQLEQSNPEGSRVCLCASVFSGKSHLKTADVKGGEFAFE